MNKEWIRELWRFRELFYFLAWRDVKIRYKQTALGVAWAILQPLLTMLVFLVLFGRVAKLPTDGVPAPLFYYAGLIPWIYFSTALGMSANSLAGNANLLTKVYFPRSILPASSVLSGLVDYAFGALLLVVLLLYYRIPFSWEMPLLLLLTVLLVLLTYAVGIFLAALTVKYRDVKYAVPFAIQLGLFVTPVIYPVSLMPKAYQPLLALNPLSAIVDSYRAALIPHTSVNWSWLGVSSALTLVILVLASAYFAKAERSFADLI